MRAESMIGRWVVLTVLVGGVSACSTLRMPSASEVVQLFQKPKGEAPHPSDHVQKPQPIPVDAAKAQPSAVKVGLDKALAEEIQKSSDAAFYLLDVAPSSSKILAVSETMFTSSDLGENSEILWGSASKGLFMPAYDQALQGKKPAGCRTYTPEAVASLVYHPCKSNTKLWREVKFLPYFDGVKQSELKRLGLLGLDYQSAHALLVGYQHRFDGDAQKAAEVLRAQAARAQVSLRTRDESGFLDKKSAAEVNSLLEQSVRFKIKDGVIPKRPDRVSLQSSGQTRQERVLLSLQRIENGGPAEPKYFTVEESPVSVGVGMLVTKFDRKALSQSKKTGDLQYSSDVIVTGVRMLDRPLFSLMRSDSVLSIAISETGDAILKNNGSVSVSVDQAVVSYSGENKTVTGPGVVAAGKSVTWKLFEPLRAGAAYSGYRVCTLSQAHSATIDFEVDIKYTSESGAVRVLNFSETRPFLDVAKFAQGRDLTRAGD